MSLPERPQLRPHLAAQPSAGQARYFLVWDQLRLSEMVLRLTPHELQWVQLFDGQRTLADIQAAAMQLAGGIHIPLEYFGRLADRLAAALFLDGPAFQARVNHPVRSPSCTGCYGTDPVAVRDLLDGLFRGPGGSGLPGKRQPDNRLRAVLVPHIDYARGGRTYTWAFKEVVERSAASLFVIVATSHYSRHRFTLTRKNFQTPLGLVSTDQDYIDRLVRHYGPGLFDDEWLAHLPEHSIELEVVFLQHLYADRPIRIVPLVVGSFHDAIAHGKEPRACPDIERMIAALQAAERETKEPLCYLISGDLAHIGPKFGDPDAVSDPQLAHSRAQDQALLRRTEAVDAAGYFHVIAAEKDERRICGLPPTYTVLQALRPSHGQLLHYDQYVHPHGHESVSFASVVFYR
jgi:AmmeMemoRadiSam system protein B